MNKSRYLKDPDNGADVVKREDKSQEAGADNKAPDSQADSTAKQKRKHRANVIRIVPVE